MPLVYFGKRRNLYMLCQCFMPPVSTIICSSVLFFQPSNFKLDLISAQMTKEYEVLVVCAVRIGLTLIIYSLLLLVKEVLSVSVVV
jgi:hypothetical protein